MSLLLTAPSKTFIIGEYLVLETGRAWVACTNPSFRMRVKPPSETTLDFSGAPAVKGVHWESPAGKAIAENVRFLNGWELEFEDPHLGKGGFGASTAQYLFAYSVLRSLTGGVASTSDVGGLLHDYQKRAWNGEGPKPSGADLVAQLYGGLAQVDLKKMQVRRFEWRWPDLDFVIVRTGLKVPTHDHLKTLGSFDRTLLQENMDLFETSVVNQDPLMLIRAIAGYDRALDELGFVSPEVKPVQNRISIIEGVSAVKGCGALGADTVLAIVDRSRVDLIKAEIKEKGYEIVATSADLAEGLKMGFAEDSPHYGVKASEDFELSSKPSADPEAEV